MSTEEETRTQNDRLELLLNLTSKITSSLDLREVLRAVAANIREVIHAEGVTVSLQDAASEKFRVFAIDFPHGKGVLKEDLVARPSTAVKEALETLRPVVSHTCDGNEFVSEAEGLKAYCCILALVSITAVAQENRSEISIQGTGFFTKDTAGNGVSERANETGGFLVGYRYNFNRWLAAEANYGYDRNTQFYFGGTPARVQSDIHQITGSAVVKLPSFARLEPYALAGAGALVFDPTGNSGGPCKSGSRVCWGEHRAKDRLLNAEHQKTQAQITECVSF